MDQEFRFQLAEDGATAYIRVPGRMSKADRRVLINQVQVILTGQTMLDNYDQREAAGLDSDIARLASQEVES